MSYVSFCCTVPNMHVPDNDFCMACGEHSSFYDDDCEFCNGTGEIEFETDGGKIDWEYCPKCYIE